jgi:hypothetical protein
MSPQTIVSFEFGSVELYDTYLVATMNEGVTIMPEHNEELVIIANSHFMGRPFGYITHRKNSYAVDPSIYYKTSKIENLVAFAIVSKNPMASKTAAVEQMFMEKPFQLFQELEDAIGWASTLVDGSN